MALSDEENTWLAELLNLTEDAGLNDFEEGFVADQRKRYDQYGADIRLSPKQWNVLFGIAERVGHPLPPGKHYEGRR